MIHAVAKVFSRRSLQSGYIAFIGIFGLIILSQTVLGFFTRPLFVDYSPNLFLLLIIIAILIQLGTRQQPKNFQELGSIISLTAGALFGVEAAVIIIVIAMAIGEVGRKQKYSKSLYIFAQHLTFNLGMFTIAIFFAIRVFDFLMSLGDNFFWYWFVWLATGILFERFNRGMLTVMLWIQDEPLSQESVVARRWTAILNILSSSFGAGLFATAISMTGMIGAVIFSFPIFMMLITFRVHFQKSDEQQRILENIVTERTADLQVANDELKTVITQKDRFLAILSHDMKTPLTAIRLYGQILQKDKISAARRNKFAQTILDSENRLTNLVLDILDVEKLQKGSVIDLSKQKMDFVETVKVALSIVQPQAKHKQVGMVFNRPNYPISLNGDNEKLLRTVLNLCSNAIKYTPSDGSVTVSLVQQREQCQLTIADTGYGIPGKDIDLIFSPYHRVEENNQYASGSGLGLSIVKFMIEEHGGSISVKSEVGVGSTFTVMLPLFRGETIPIEELTIHVDNVASTATTDLQDSPTSLPHRLPNESQAPEQTHTNVLQVAIQL